MQEGIGAAPEPLADRPGVERRTLLPQPRPILLMGPGGAPQQGGARVGLEKRRLTLEALRLAPIVGVLARDPDAAREVQAAVERRRQTAVRLRINANAGIA